MSSILDAVIRSDNTAAEERLRSESTAPQRQRPSNAPSSSRPRGPPSVSTPGLNSDMLPFADDEVVGLRGNQRGPRQPGPKPDVHKVTDAIGEQLVNEFERFLDG